MNRWERGPPSIPVQQCNKPANEADCMESSTGMDREVTQKSGVLLDGCLGHGYSSSPPGLDGCPSRTGRSCACATAAPDLLLPEPGRDFGSAEPAVEPEEEDEDKADAAAAPAPRTGDELREGPREVARDAAPDRVAPPDLGLAPPTPAPPAPPPLALRIFNAISACSPLSNEVR